MSASEKNSTSKPLKKYEAFVGVAEDVSKYGSYTIAVRSSTAIQYKIYQGQEPNRWDDIRIVQQAALPPPNSITDNEPSVFKGLIKMKYIKVEILNTEEVDQTYLRSSMIFRAAMPLNSLDDSISVGGIDENGTKHLLATTPEGVLKTNTTVSVEDIKLDGATDSIRIMGSTDQDVANIKLINTDVNGKLNINVDATTQQLLTDILAKQALIEANIQKMEINANQAPIVTTLVSSDPATQFANGQVIGTVIDMGTMETRTNDICFSGEAIIGAEGSGYDAPNVLMQFSNDNIAWYSDGVQASFYKHSATDWTFNFQRNNVGLRYVRLLCSAPIQLLSCIVTTFKN
jgi:hypothetical protein